MDDAVACIDHFVKVAGIDHVGIGSDFDGITLAPKGLEDESKMPAVTAALMRKGYSERDIRKIMGENFLRVVRQVVGHLGGCTSEEILMSAIEQKRRTVLFGLGGLGISKVLAQGMTRAQAAAPQGYVLGAAEGEHLVHFRDHGNIFIKVGSATGSDNLALGTQQVTVGAGIPIHRHFQMDEAFFVLEGSGIFILNEVRHSFEKGGTIFIFKNSWHGFANPDHELLLVWILSPTGLDGFFRDTCNPPGVPPKQLTREQINEIARKYATEFK